MTITPTDVLNVSQARPDGWHGAETYYMLPYGNDGVVIAWLQDWEGADMRERLMVARWNGTAWVTGPRHDWKFGPIAYRERTYFAWCGSLLVGLDIQTRDLVTFTIDPATLAFTEIDRTAVPMSTRYTNYLGSAVRPITWDSNTLLLVNHRKSSTGVGQVMFARWNGSGWNFSEARDHTKNIGSPDYISCRKISPNYAVALDTGPNAYLMIGGAYPDPPTLEVSSASVMYQVGNWVEELFDYPYGTNQVLRLANDANTRIVYFLLTMNDGTGALTQGNPTFIRSAEFRDPVLAGVPDPIDLGGFNHEAGQIFVTVGGGNGVVETSNVYDPWTYTWPHESETQSWDWYRSAAGAGSMYFSAYTESMQWGLRLRGFGQGAAPPPLSGWVLGSIAT